MMGFKKIQKQNLEIIKNKDQEIITHKLIICIFKLTKFMVKLKDDNTRNPLG